MRINHHLCLFKEFFDAGAIAKRDRKSLKTLSQATRSERDIDGKNDYGYINEVDIKDDVNDDDDVVIVDDDDDDDDDEDWSR
ncbi:hypothetical protein ElyMa_001765400 [Elysia marginata]|uniref:Uncharacterized protein n=1 Tax=Elysia marginata TaxID=1093978 RepID=A0AAV4EBF1_9GAST|nr:hypothetical protein ElyMa_001765400 [Elysia marginata]